MTMSHTIKFNSCGGPEVLKLIEEVLNPLQSDEVLIKHEAIGVNFIETYYRSGLYPTNLPSGLGTEAAGTVLAVGKEVNHLKVGDRAAYAQGPLGSYSELRNIPARFVVKIPDGISFEEAAGVLLKGMTVQYLFRQTYKLQEGETILFHAAAGGVGLIACQWAKYLGVKLIGTVSSEEKAQLARSKGAWEIINYSKENVPESVFKITQGKKVPVVYDGVGKDTWEASLDSLAPRGLLVSFGNASGPVTNVNLSTLAQKGSLYVTRPILATYVDTAEKLQSSADEVFDLVLKKKIHVSIDERFKLSDAPEAHKFISNRKSMGSTILIP